MSDLPAILGGVPAFQSKINIVRPVMPDFSEMADGVQSILRSGMVTKGRASEEPLKKPSASTWVSSMPSRFQAAPQA